MTDRLDLPDRYRNIPIIVQTHDWANLPESFHEEIGKQYVVLQETRS